MPHTGRVNGASLVPDFSDALGIVLGIAQERKQEQKAEDIRTESEALVGDIFAGDITELERQQGLADIAIINPELAKTLGSIIESGDKRQIAEFQKMNEKANADANLLWRIKDPKKRQEAIQDLIGKSIAANDPPEATKLLFDLANEDPDQQNTTILRQLLTTDAGKKALGGLEPERKVEQIRTTEGVVLGQQEFEIDPVTREKRPIGKIEASPLTQKAPEVKEFKEGSEIVTKQFNSKTGQFDIEVARAPAVQTKPIAKFVPVFAEDGKTVIGQKNTLTNEIKSDPRTIKDTTLIQTLKAIGVDPDTEEGKKLILEILKKPKVKIDINKENQGLFKTPQGFMLLDPKDPTKGVTPIPGGPKDAVSAENAGRSQMLRTAQKAAKGMAALVFTKVNIDGTIPDDAEIDRVNLVNAQLGTPGTEGRDLRNKMEFGIQAITRIETGAAMPDSEVDNTRQRFMPHPLDSKKIIRLKLEMFDDFIGGALKLLDPTGRFDVERFQVEFDRRLQESELKREAQPKRKKFNPKTGRLE